MKEVPGQILDSDTLISSAWQSAIALVQVGAKTGALAVSEFKLATSSAALALCTAAFLILMLTTFWLLILVAGFFLLRHTGFEPMPAIGILAFIQLTGCLGLAWLLKVLVHQMRFVNTRRAVREKLSDATSTLTTSKTAL